MEQTRKFATGAELIALQLWRDSGLMPKGMSYVEGVGWAVQQTFGLVQAIQKEQQEAQRAEQLLKEEQENGNQSAGGGGDDGGDERRDAFVAALGQS